MNRLRSQLAWISRILLVAFFGLQYQVATAGLVTTDDLLAESPATGAASELRLQQQATVIAALNGLGVETATATQRVAALSDNELNQLATQLDELPAGGDILGTLVFVFLVLLVTDILGFTDVFPFVKKTAHVHRH